MIDLPDPDTHGPNGEDAWTAKAILTWLATPPAPDALREERLAHAWQDMKDENYALRAKLAVYEADALRLAREAVDAMDAAEVAWRADVSSNRAAAHYGLCQTAAHLLSVRAVRALPSGAAEPYRCTCGDPTLPGYHFSDGHPCTTKSDVDDVMVERAMTAFLSQKVDIKKPGWMLEQMRAALIAARQPS